MNNNDVLRRLRYALNVTDLKVLELFRLAGRDMERPELESIFLREEEPGYVECSDALLGDFLEGLIISRRGKREKVEVEQEAPTEPSAAMSHAGPGRIARQRRLFNNDILKSLRIALSLKDEDILAIMRLAGTEVSKSELSALFRKPGQPNYRPCGDQFLRNFLAGLTARYRV